MKKVLVIDYGVGNIASIENMLKKIGFTPVVSNSIDALENASHIILPGVGLFDVAMKRLEELNLITALNYKVVNDKTPILGICLGMQLLTRRSEEGSMSGLGWIDAEVFRFDSRHGNEQIKVPHMGWNVVNVKKESKLFPDKNIEYRFYFVHSYYVRCFHEGDVLAETTHGGNFVSAFEKENIVGVQFHPEKSHKFGLEFFSNFMEHY